MWSEATAETAAEVLRSEADAEEESDDEGRPLKPDAGEKVADRIGATRRTQPSLTVTSPQTTPGVPPACCRMARGIRQGAISPPSNEYGANQGGNAHSGPANGFQGYIAQFDRFRGAASRDRPRDNCHCPQYLPRQRSSAGRDVFCSAPCLRSSATRRLCLSEPSTISCASAELNPASTRSKCTCGYLYPFSSFGRLSGSYITAPSLVAISHPSGCGILGRRDGE